MSWLHYLLEANLYLGVFYLGYYLFLSRETYYTLNRMYLLFSCVISFALPVFQLGILKPFEVPVTAVHFSFTTYPTKLVPVAPVAATPLLTWQDALVYGYVLGAIILLVILLIKLYSLYKLTRRQNFDADSKYKLVYIDQSATAFSFFNYLFIGTNVDGSETIIRHELVHIRQKHSFDIIFIELLKIVNWFNPFVYLIQYSLRTLHEYIADEQTAIAENDALAYSSFLVNNAYGLGGSSITHSFFNFNLLKKRIIMLHQKRSGSLARLKYLVAVPICAGLLCASTLAFSKSYGWVDIGPHRIDKNNKSPQVAEPKRSLLVRQHGLSYLTDKFSYKLPNGSTRVYTGYNLSNKDAVDLAKKGIQIDVLYNAKVEKVDTKKLTFGGNDTAKHIAPPAPPVHAVTFPAPKDPKTTTSKGYRYAEGLSVVDGKSDMQVMIYEKNQDIRVFHKNTLSASAAKLLKDKYGYVFPDHFRMPPPPPAPPAAKVIKFPPPNVVPAAPKVVRFPPPMVVSYTKKGYKYSEDGYLINDKTDFRVIITEKDGDQKEYFKSKASDADSKLLKEKYGYTFPEMEIHTKLPPPPPAPPAKTGMVAPKAKHITIAMAQKANLLSVDSDAVNRREMIVVVRKKGC